MFLKSIEVHGFKAFANKIRFEFDKGITGIVGPNGSGKSNVADAVRWVLGEQSPKQLRGSSMQDVIFSGTETRKPMGFAYVTLTLDNTDHWLPIEFEEVTVGRRVYRSGESEYLINGAVCRLRDVQELFFDTGVGKEGYSIIGQGQIDKVLSGKPEERREIFDEAAGITKYKKRKTMAERDLEAERTNLTRVSDIIAEIANQLGPLEKQDEKARIYLKYKEELKHLEVNQFLLEYERSAALKKELEEKYQIASGDLSKARQDFEQAKEEYDRLLDRLERHQASLQDARERRAEAMLEAEKASGEMNVLYEQISALKDRRESASARLNTLSETLAVRQESLLESNRQQEEYKRQMDELFVAQQNAERALGEMKTGIHALLQQEKECGELRIQTLNSSAELKAELLRCNTLLEQQAIARAEANARLLRCKTEADRADSAVQAAKQALKDAADAVCAAADALQEMEEKTKRLSEQLKQEEAKRAALQEEIVRDTSRLEALQNLLERYDGFGNAVRKCMEQKKNFPGIHGVVAELIAVEPLYETAIETALGGNLQNIITDTTETAKLLISFLKDNRLGRATFLPLSGIRAKKEEFSAEILSGAGVIGTANSLIKSDSIYEEAFRYLLGRFLVVDTIDHAIALEKKHQHSLRIVTLDGELFQPGGSISGGAYKNNSNLLGRRREMEKLEESLRQKRSRLEPLAANTEKLHDKRRQLRELQEEKKTALQELYVRQNTAKLELNHVQQETQELLGSRNAIREEIRQLEQQIAQGKQEAGALEKRIQETEEVTLLHEQTAAKVQQELSAAREEEDRQSAEAVRVLTEYSGLQQNVQYRKEEINRLTLEIHELQREHDAVLAAAEKDNAEVLQRSERIDALLAEKERWQAAIVELDGRIEETGRLADEITKQNKSFFEKRERLSNQISQLDREAFRLQSQQEKLEEQLADQTRYMWEEYEITYALATEDRDEEITNPALTRKQIYELKGKIRGLGDVNVNAIEEYRAAKERYEFLCGQKDDIKAAEESLVGIINDLEVQMRRQFTETFAQVQQRFDKVFRELFGGGRGTLELQECDDVLEAGILIIAQPPGKKLQNMMQLSGGEKALTAISLLFAILDLKPSPFCLLDEIEAALDDSNVTRFAQYLHKLTKETQFIVITHRRGTMAAADALYGITMQEKGVSTLVSVSLIEKDLDK